MITTALLFLLNAFLGFFISLLPTGGLPAGINSALTQFFGIAHSFDKLLPITELFAIIGIILSFEAAIQLFKLVKWFLGLIRGGQ